MIIYNIELINFGIYGGEQRHQFELSPESDGNFQRPIVLFRGKNGVGKTTLAEAIRLCLHGSLVLGNRVGQREYDEYLRQKIHHHGNGQARATRAGVVMYFEYVRVGKRIQYEVGRHWEVQENRVAKSLFIQEDKREILTDADLDEKDRFLRELIPPGIIDLFFFDGEKIQTLAEDGDSSNLLLAETVKGLLGTDLVEQLGNDLDVYITRQDSHGSVAGLQRELEELSENTEALGQQLERLQDRQQEAKKAIAETEQKISAQERRITHAGGEYAKRRDSLVFRQRTLETEIEVEKRQMNDMCGGLVPFAVVPSLLNSVAQRLSREKQIQQALAAREALSQLKPRFLEDQFWADVAQELPSPAREQIFRKLETALYSEDEHDRMILQVSDRERELLLAWIEQALYEIPAQFTQVVEQLVALEQKLADVNVELAQVPDERSLQPLVQRLNELQRELWQRETQRQQLEEQGERHQTKCEWLEAQKQRVRDQIAAHETETSRVYLAAKTQEVLAEYRAQVTRRKLAELEKLLVQRFNQLCSKETFLNRVQIDPLTFQITLYRLNERFGRQQLSAGERQLFAIATLWALREISGRPLPVLIDTPLSRLDSEHRLSMVREFFPHVSHQLIVLATDAEIDDQMAQYMRPAVSHTYQLWYDTQTRATRHQLHTGKAEGRRQIRLEEVAVA